MNFREPTKRKTDFHCNRLAIYSYEVSREFLQRTLKTVLIAIILIGALPFSFVLQFYFIVWITHLLVLTVSSPLSLPFAPFAFYTSASFFLSPFSFLPVPLLSSAFSFSFLSSSFSFPLPPHPPHHPLSPCPFIPFFFSWTPISALRVHPLPNLPPPPPLLPQTLKHKQQQFATSFPSPLASSNVGSMTMNKILWYKARERKQLKNNFFLFCSFVYCLFLLLHQ